MEENMSCKYQMERDVNQILWYSVFDEDGEFSYGRDGNNFENETFEVKSYDWNEEGNNDYHFYHKPSGLKVCWYKYPLRSPMSNMKNITHEQFLAVLRDCWNSMKTGIYYDVDSWWK